jgi:hypothetical protein
MFLPVEFKDKDGSYYEQLNVTHITRTSFINRMNPDAGSKIHMRTGEVLTTSVPYDVLSTAIDECWKSAASMIMFSILAEKAKILSTKDFNLEDLEPSESKE